MSTLTPAGRCPRKGPPSYSQSDITVLRAIPRHLYSSPASQRARTTKFHTKHSCLAMEISFEDIFLANAERPLSSPDSVTSRQAREVAQCVVIERMDGLNLHSSSPDFASAHAHLSVLFAHEWFFHCPLRLHNDLGFLAPLQLCRSPRSLEV
ncbi:hypothetical protein FA95DRAFT_1042716 [Auriscalpium vulgare]|uniref:Uncharacterized protein n=1 Tax=Auriscalpium vulgare TaxID=40419 RepID=A0ACB8R5G7_9AGAM|nr:hypothetical protein FA95DRAFT_1042716 [Auriscalpium vulgare]